MRKQSTITEKQIARQIDEWCHLDRQLRRVERFIEKISSEVMFERLAGKGVPTELLAAARLKAKAHRGRSRLSTSAVDEHQLARLHLIFEQIRADANEVSHRMSELIYGKT
jgi:hypothetical protein